MNATCIETFKYGRIASLLFILLIFSDSIIAASVERAVDYTTLYNLRTAMSDVYRHVYTALGYEHRMVLSTSSRVLSSGTATDLAENAEICPGMVIVTDTIFGNWAQGGTYSATRIAEPYGYTDVCWPIPDDYTIVSNVPIRWSVADYNSFRSEDMCWSDEACWGREGTLTDQPTEYDTNLYPGAPYDNKLGHTAVICKGTDDLIVRRGGITVSDPAPQGTDTAFGRTASNIFGYSVNLLAEGTYRFESRFTVNGCTAIIRYPYCPRYETEMTFNRAEARPDGSAPEYYYNRIPGNTINIRVQNKQASLQVVSTVPASSSPITLAPRGSLPVTMNIRNNGQVTVMATGVTATNGFTATPMPCPTTGTTGFRINIPRRNTATLCVLLTAPAYSGTASTRIGITYTATESTCAAERYDTRNFNITYNVIQGGDTNGPLVTFIGHDPTTVTPATPVRINATGDDTTTGNSTISMCQLELDGSGAWNNMAAADGAYNSPAENATYNPGALSAGTHTIRVRCIDSLLNTGPIRSYNINVGAGSSGSGDGIICATSPLAVSMRQNSTFTFGLACINASSSLIPCYNVTWDLNGLAGRFVERQIDFATVNITTGSGTGTIRATINRTANCNSTITINNSAPPTGGSGATCSIAPPFISLRQNDTFTFDLDCRDTGNSTIACANVTWGISGIIATFIERANDHSTLFINSSTGNGVLNANVNNSFGCIAGIGIERGNTTNITGNGTTGPISNGCIISPSYNYAHRNELVMYTIRCPNNVREVCSNVRWVVNAAFGMLLAADDTIALIRTSNNVGQGVIEARTDGNNYCTAIQTVSDVLCRDFI